MEQVKTCKTCGHEKPLSAFYEHKGMADGYLNECKECRKTAMRKARAKNAEHYREYDRERYRKDPKVRERINRYLSTDRGKQKAAEAKRRWQKQNPDKRAAHVILGNAVRDGRISKPDKCQDCGEGGVIHAHHDDYAKPLEVRWVCAYCHKRYHELEN